MTMRKGAKTAKSILWNKQSPPAVDIASDAYQGPFSYWED